MKSDIIRITNDGTGFEKAVNETLRIGDYEQLSDKDSLHLELITEEMLSMVRILTGETDAVFWIEAENGQFDLHLNTEAVMDKKKRAMLISTSSSNKNEAANSFLGYLRDMFEKAMAQEIDKSDHPVSDQTMNDIPIQFADHQEWDGYEQSVLRNLADDIRISIRGKVVDMTVKKSFTK
ncbi:MAG: hypothetical protein IKP86_02325 [Anaerolineaceae bacterium]|nr:hypothetical protein [Anaerolineaceae bacterium]